MAFPNEKESLPVAHTPIPQQTPKKTSSWAYRFKSATAVILIVNSLLIFSLLIPLPDDTLHPAASSSCQQADPIFPKAVDHSELVKGEKGQIISWLSDAVKIPTEIFDVMGEIGEDERWDVFYEFSEYLEKAFPLVHQHLKRTRVVTHALVYEWEGSNPSLKPLLITGHQDVVPVLPATRDQWSHDPFGGEYDGTYIWGRGSSDDKSGTIGVLAGIELLLKSGKFQPRRTVILGFGIDEETGGKVGAYHIGQWLEDKYGKDSIALLVDEGNGVQEVWGQLFAAPAVGEKGYFDLELRVETLGGHSSVPPPHTSIGYLSLLIAAIEKNPHKPYLSPNSPLVNYISCAANSPAQTPSDLAKAIKKVDSSISRGGAKGVDKKALKKVEDWWVEGSWEDGTLNKGQGKAMVSTTQAVDIVYGGLKVNALPESVSAVVNHRINIASSVAELQSHLIDVLSPIAKKYNLAINAFGKDIQPHGCHSSASSEKGPKAGKIVLAEAFNSALDPAPVSPFTVDSPAWRLLSGTVKGVYATRPEVNGTSEGEKEKEIYMAPSISTGNTDTKRYWNLTKNIYRFAYQLSKDFNNVHTVDEHISADVFVEQVRWFINFIVNVDESDEI
ncbi:hypothetical protein B9479_007279 [Cryptococcus floricola]|uniref:Peptidase M20 dimerisation domain-containing protein n=1 Tax=Cryptococcus floricola TaxID=2591691 RepID=A0A5D3AKU1_9TREE|nr:hypothetical protein B9479_007279 [Cryptococcus floricola]